VVQYDDVINRQRETIYHERERILRSDDLAPTVLAMLDEEVRALVAEHTGGEFAAEWNVDGLRTRLLAMVPTLDQRELAAIDALVDRDQISELFATLVEDAYRRKRAEVGDDGMLVLERLVLLRVIDSLWVEHLTAVDDMRRGIGLRAYSQRDPLNEFKVEAYKMFDELKSTIRHDITHTIFRVTLTREPVQRRPGPMIESRPDVTGGEAESAAAAPLASGGNGSGPSAPAKQSGPKVGRNDPCWCGSGKKFKRCHGA
ncbi:MAG: SEC-C metal-binding domain-containing protein, partial [Candidatus Limnocylindria bacterium]